MSDAQELRMIFDQDYFERGVATGKSLYINYSWMPELTLRMAHHIIRHLGIKPGDKVLDFGCAKGYLVKALRILDIEAYGVDVSEYAIGESPVPKWVKLIDPRNPDPFDFNFDFVISKDVLEHMELGDIRTFLAAFRGKGWCRMFHVVPLGDNGIYRIPEYERDPSHLIAESEQWWADMFQENGWNVRSFAFDVLGIKENWNAINGNGNGFFELQERLSQ